MKLILIKCRCRILGSRFLLSRLLLLLLFLLTYLGFIILVVLAIKIEVEISNQYCSSLTLSSMLSYLLSTLMYILIDLYSKSLFLTLNMMICFLYHILTFCPFNKKFFPLRSFIEVWKRKKNFSLFHKDDFSGNWSLRKLFEESCKTLKL